MADVKISALPSSTTPLAGTEVVPLVQSGATKKVAVSDLTAGRAVSGLSFSAGTNIGLTNTSASAYSGIALNSNDSNTSTRNWGVISTYNNYGDLCFVQSSTQGGSPVGGTVRAEFVNSGADFKISTGNLVQGTAAKGVNFTANSAAAGMTSQLLNWYEEGGWTPTDQSGAGLTLTGGGSYTRIGRMVLWQAVVVYPATANVSGTLIGGLPYTIAGGGSSQGRAGSYITATDKATIVNTLQIDGSTTVRLYKAAFVQATNADMSGGTVYFAGIYFV